MNSARRDLLENNPDMLAWMGRVVDVGSSGKLQLESLIKALLAAIYTTDAEGHITFYNEAAAESAATGTKSARAGSLRSGIGAIPCPRQPRCPSRVIEKPGAAGLLCSPSNGYLRRSTWTTRHFSSSSFSSWGAAGMDADAGSSRR
jgi:hypothetical protein